MASLKQQMLSGIAYTAIAKYSGLFISLGVMAVLARLLTPDDFGTVAVATVFINFFNIFTNIGLSSALVQRKELTTQEINHIYMFTIWVGILLSVLFFASAPFVADYYQDSRLTSICRWLSLSLFFASAGIVPNTLFFRDKDFKFIAWRTFAIQLFCGVVSILAARWGAGLYTLLIQPVLSAVLIYLISLHRYPQRWLWTTGIGALRTIWEYSLYQFLFSVMAYFVRNLDKLLIGRYIGMAPLGYYEKSYRLMSLPIQNITHVITPVLHPLLSDFQKDREHMATINEKMVRLLAFIGFPLSIVLYCCARELMLIVFGAQWESAIPAFEILSLSVGFQIVMSSSGSYYQSCDDTRGLFLCGAFTAVSTCTGFLICILFFPTLEAFAWSMLVSYGLCFVQCYWLLYRTDFHRPLLMFYSQMVSPLMVTVIMGVAMWGTDRLLDGVGESPLFVSLSLKCFIALAVWIGFIQWRGEYDLVGKLKSKIRKS